MVNVKIDGISLQVPERTTILDAAAMAGVKIPTLCYWKGLNEIGACRVCLVEVVGQQRLCTACNNTVFEGMTVYTNSKSVRNARRNNVELILSQHYSHCPTCARSGNCSLQKMANDLNIQEISFPKDISEREYSQDFPLIRDETKCIKCMRCVQVCDKIQASHVWDVINTGSRITIGVNGAYTLEDSDCALCGQCITHCPVGALKERDDTEKVMAAIEDTRKIVLVQIAPAVRTAWGEYFGLTPDVATVQLLGTALRRAGVNYVFDTDFSADLTIMEEGSEFLEKLEHADENKFPMFTSCCPGWVRFVKAHYPEYVDHLSTAKSPQQMFGAVAKSYYAEKLGVDPKLIYSVSVMPCLAKKHEAAIPAMNDACGEPDVDAVLTTREVVRLIRAAHIQPADLKPEPLDMPLGIGSGAGNIFGATGGVMEAALRSAYYLVTGKNPEPDAFQAVRGMEGWKEATFDLAGKQVRIAVVNGLGNANKLLKALKAGKVQYDFVEVMACPGGCVGGGGQPLCDGVFMAEKRGPVLYAQDAAGTLRFCHENPSIQAIYKEYLDQPLSWKAHHLLHTDHTKWKMPKEQ